MSLEEDRQHRFEMEMVYEVTQGLPATEIPITSEEIHDHYLSYTKDVATAISTFEGRDALFPSLAPNRGNTLDKIHRRRRAMLYLGVVLLGEPEEAYERSRSMAAAQDTPGLKQKHLQSGVRQVVFRSLVKVKQKTPQLLVGPVKPFDEHTPVWAEHFTALPSDADDEPTETAEPPIPLNEHATSAIVRLPEGERQVMLRLFGLTGCAAQSYEEIATALHVSRNDVLSMGERALQTLRKNYFFELFLREIGSEPYQK